jgi:CxxC-x17-CxxC domain-containing protein
MKNFKNTGDRDSKRSDSKFGGERRGSSDGRRDSGRREGGFGGSRNRSRGGSRDGGFGGRRDSGFGGEKVMHRATCAECGNSCEVPFKPTGEKPVYCSTCFANRVV